MKPPLVGGDNKGVEFLIPLDEVLTITGKMFYHEGSQAWAMMRLKKEIIDRYPHLKEKTGKFIYMAKMHDNFKQLKKDIEDLEKKSGAIPIILFLAKDNNRKEDKY